MKLLRLFLCLAFFVLSVSASMGTAMGAARMTKAQVIERAAEFCRAVGAPVSGDATTEFPARNVPGVPAFQWRSRWHVVFDGAEVDVVDDTGLVCYYMNHTLYQQLADDKRLPVPSLSEAEAVKRADAVIQATGQKEELGPPKATLSSLGPENSVSAASWSVFRKRLYQGVPYSEDHTVVGMQAETGQVKMVVVKHSMISPNVASMKALLVFDQDRAMQRARAHLTDAGLDGAGAEFLRADRALVQPNTFWEDGRASNRLAVPVRPAWMLLFKVGERNACFVWIDAQTGRVIGGDDVSSVGSPLRAKPAPKPAQPTPKKPH